MHFIPYLSFDKSCREAFTWYAEVLGGKILSMMNYNDVPPGAEMPEIENKELIMHACITVGQQRLMGGDQCFGEYTPPSGQCVCLEVESCAEAERIFNKFAEGGKVTMPMGETFWAERFGMVTDRFNTPWIINGGPKPDIE